MTLGVLEHVVIHQPKFGAVQGLRHPAQRTGSEGILAEQGLLLIQVEDHQADGARGQPFQQRGKQAQQEHAIVGAQPGPERR